MQIPPTTALLNVAASLPAMGAAATAPAAVQAAPPPPANTAAGDAAKNGGLPRRGSLVNIIA